MRVEGAPIVAVLGAINVDLVVSGAPLPGAGTDAHGWDVRAAPRREGWQSSGRDGAGDRERVHVIVEASRPRAAAWMLGAVGDDELGVRCA